jgi:hypothetical protein
MSSGSYAGNQFAPQSCVARVRPAQRASKKSGDVRANPGDDPMTRWPWITLVVAVPAGVSPLGQELFYSAFLSGDQLGRSIARPIFFMGAALLIVLVFTEWLVRSLIVRHRRARSVADAPAPTTTES